MVNSEFRKAYAGLLADFWQRRISQAEYECRFNPLWDSDAGIKGVYENIWSLYDDVKRDGLSQNKETEGIIMRCLLFLSTTMDYEWTNYKETREKLLRDRIFDWLLVKGYLRVPQHWHPRQLKTTPKSDLDNEAWPFARLSDLEKSRLDQTSWAQFR